MFFGSEDGSAVELLELRRRGGGARLRGRFQYNKSAVLSDGGRRGGRPRKERIKPGAFSHRLDDPDEDIHLLVGHDFGKPLASKKTKTLTFRDTPEALEFDAEIRPEIAETAHGKDALRLVEAGLADGVSPGFRLPPPRAVKVAEIITQEAMRPERGQHGAIIREVVEALLYELSLVTRPAYPSARVVMRDGAAELVESARSWELSPAADDVPAAPRRRGLLL